ncbi:MAG TPA: PDZ domain-containing protein [Actinophytocola sp.]|uniref:YlbL family protein n=1 Tax=Actinophytocola sp. TaxID=1872138 RepID=UPI002DBEE04C|nr:PDZ domain-containing protein [Actinophytocola sp.]HEU5472548.1 PDZ domain-containing protein [Actinophytocola sp.]
MSDSISTGTLPPAPPAEPVPERGHWRLSRRGWTVLLSFVIFGVLGLVGSFVQVPYVALGPGPTYDTLGEIDDVQIVQVEGEQTFPTSGQLRMTTVSVDDHVTLFGAAALWASGRYALAPRDEYIRPGETEEQVEQENKKLFQDSQSNAEVAALRYLGYPVKVLVAEVTAKTPADGVIAPGDRLLEVNGKKIEVQEDVRASLQGTTPGQRVSVTFQHEDEEPKTEAVTLGRASDFNPEDQRAEGFMGLSPIDRADVDFTTTIHLQDVGGPSAGLIFALAIVDRLTPGELEAGRVVAGTGEIDVKGNVAPIGGIPFKMVAAREAGANTFLVPAANCAEANEKVPDGLRLVRVETLSGAVRALDDLRANREVPSC